MPTYTLIDNKKITPSTLLITLQRDDYERPLAFQPGQYAAINYQVKGRRSVTRCFSIVSPPTDQDVLQFSMRLKGKFTTALSKVPKGSKVEVEGPFGGFVFNVTQDKRAVFMAGGIGITPFISMMRHLERLKASNDVVLLYSCATQDDIPFGDELMDIQRKYPNLKTIFVIGNGPTDKLPSHHAVAGRISPELLEHVTRGIYAQQRFFICGPPPFMKAMVDTLTKKNVAHERILTEAFTQSSPKQTNVLRSWPANAYALGALSMGLGSLAIMADDLLKALPPTSTRLPTANSPYLLTSDRQLQLDQLVNTYSPSATVITAPTQQTTASSAPTTTTAPPISSGTSTRSIAPITTAPATSAPATTAPTTTAAPAPRTSTSAAP
jgi:ferredoxin-NADP reductase